MHRFHLSAVVVLAVLSVVLTSSCSPRISVFPGHHDPLVESDLEGSGADKILVIPVQGFISDQPRRGLVSTRPSMVQEVVSRLRKAAEDSSVKGVVLAVDSPGGTTTGSDILYHEIMAFKEKAGVEVTACMMDVAASGGYYVALAADRIFAHPTTITGSVGVIFLTPRAYGLMDKVGVSVDVAKSGRNKDMGYPTRPATPEEKAIMQSIIDSMADRFWSLVEKHRGLQAEAMDNVKTARIYDAPEALELGLIDQVGYLSDALSEAKKRAGLKDDARVVAYRRSHPPNDTEYNTPSSNTGMQPALVNLGIENFIPVRKAGFYYLWLP